MKNHENSMTLPSAPIVDSKNIYSLAPSRCKALCYILWGIDTQTLLNCFEIAARYLASKARRNLETCTILQELLQIIMGEDHYET